MNKNLFIIAFIALFNSCVSNSTSKQADQNANTSQTKLYKFAENFKSQNLNWSQNSVVENRTNEVFAKKLDVFLKSKDALKGYKFKLEAVNEYQSGKYAAKLINDEEFNIEVVGIITDSLVNIVKEGSFYEFEGRYIKNLQQLKPYFNYGLWNVNAGKNSLVDTAKTYLGVNLFEIHSLN